MKKLLSSRPARMWLAVAGSATLVLGANYVMLQQSDRQAANDQPIALSQSIKASLEAGATANDVIPSKNVNLHTNDNVFAVITDSDKHILASSASLNGQSPLPPKGVFIYTTKTGTDTFTWAPATGVRVATHLTTYTGPDGNGFIVTGQSLRPYEHRIALYGLLAFMAWIAVLAWTFLILVFFEKKSAR